MKNDSKIRRKKKLFSHCRFFSHFKAWAEMKLLSEKLLKHFNQQGNFQMRSWMNQQKILFTHSEFTWKWIFRCHNCLLIHQLKHHQTASLKLQQILFSQTLIQRYGYHFPHWANAYVFGHPLDLSRSFPPSQNRLGPWTRTFTLHIIAFLSWNELLSRCYMNRYWFYCWKRTKENFSQIVAQRGKKSFVS